MKKIYSLISLPALLMVSSCSDKNEPMVPQTVPGEDVVFQASLPMNTRTSYGPLGTSSRPVYWTNGDLIQVASPQCANGFNNATYQVEVTSGSEVQNYADKLVHHDPTGVRWGTADPSEYRFFAMYPQCPMTINGSDMEAAVYFDPVQSSTMVKDGTKWTPSSYDMENNIMYAQPISNGDGTVKPQVTTDSEGNTVANLQFNPFSTVLHLNFAGWSTDNTAETEGFTVFSVTLKSPATTPIAGNFPLKLHSDGSLPVIGDAVASTSSSSIKLSLNQGNNMNGFTPSADETFECDFFMAPRANNANGVMNIGTGWSLEIETSAGNWSFDLGQATTAGSSLGLEPGQIHVLNIPELSISKGWVYNPDSWLAEINDPVYLTEVSLPGSWYSASNSGDVYQSDGIATQFSKGVRAFFLETRVGTTGINFTYNPFYGSGINANDTKLMNDAVNKRNGSDFTVVISGTGSNQKTYGDLNAYYGATTIDATLTAIATEIQNHQSEFAVLTLSYADGGSAGVSGFWKSVWLQKILNAINANALFKQYLYTETVNESTTVSALRGRILLKINIDDETEITSATSTVDTALAGTGTNTTQVDQKLFSQIPALFSYTNQSWSATTSEESLVSNLYWMDKPSLTDATIGRAGFFWNYTMANRTYGTGLPTLENRMSSIRSIIANSKNDRAQGEHNVFFMIGAGGSYFENTSSDKGSPTTVAENLNPFLLERINEKIAVGEASPLGLVYTNFTTGTSGQQVVDAIIRMNRRFKLLEIGGTTPSNPGTQTDAPVKSVSSTHSSGFSVDKNGWVAF